MGSEALTLDTVVRSAATGDEAALARLIAEHHPSMARVAYVICGDPEATRDAVQSAWTIAWQRLGSLRDPARIRPWLVAIAANEARKTAGRRRRSPVVDISTAVAALEGSNPDAFPEMVDLEVALRRIPIDDRRLLALRFAAGLDSAEIAAMLGMSASGVRSRLSRIVERLRTDLAIPPEIEP